MSNEAEDAYKLGMKEFKSGNVHEALQLWYHASELGNPDAMYELGLQTTCQRIATSFPCLLP